MKQRILFVLHLPPPVHGASMVGQQIKESRIINGQFECRYLNLGLSETLNEIGKNAAGKIFRYFLLLGRVFIQLLRFRPALVCISLRANGIGLYKDVPVVMLAKLSGARLVYHFHNKGVVTRQDNLFDHYLYRFIFKNAKVILLSKMLYPDVKKYVPEERVWYCANGIEEMKNEKRKVKNEETPEEGMKNEKRKVKNEREGYRGRGEGFRVSGSAFRVSGEGFRVSGEGFRVQGVGDGKVQLLFFSNLIESKGVYVLLEACKLLDKKGLDFHCTFIGGTGDITEEAFNSKVRGLGIEGRIGYLGRKYGDEKESAFACADIFVLPTYNECFPLVLIEAMQHSLPIVSTFEGAIPEMVEEGINGFLVAQKDVCALADRIEKLIGDRQLRQQMGSAGRFRYERNYTLELFEDRMEGILRGVTGGIKD